MSLIDRIAVEADLSIREAVFQRCPPDWAWHHPGSAVRHYHYWYVEKGDAHLCTRWGYFHFYPGVFMLMPMGPDLFYYGDFGASRVFDVHWGLFESPVAAPPEDLPYFYLEYPGDRGFLNTLFDRIAVADAKTEKALWLRAAFLELARSANDCQAEPSRRLALKLKRLLDRVPETRPGLDALARKLGCGEDYLIRAFRKHFHCTPRQYEIRRRMNRAAEMLRLWDSGIDEIAMHLGYPDRFSFSKQFKNFYGSSPAAFRRSARTSPENDGETL